MAVLAVDEWTIKHWWWLLRCERCQTRSLVLNIAVRPSMTAYHDPALNKPPLLCDSCAEDYFEYWNNQWAEYNASRR